MTRAPGNPLCLETHACFRVVGDALEPEAITGMVGLEPSFQRTKGELHGPRQIISRTGVWGLESKGSVSSTVLEHHLQCLLERVEGSAAELKRYVQKQKLQMDMYCYWVSAKGHGGPVISASTLHRIGDLGAALGLDLYFAYENFDADKDPTLDYEVVKGSDPGL